MQTVFPDGGLRPVAHSFRQALVGDEHAPMAELLIVDLTENRVTPVEYTPQPAIFFTPIGLERVWWSEDGQALYLVHEERDCRTLHLMRVDARTGMAEQLLEERAETGIALRPTYFGRPNVRVLDDGAEFLWYSTRDGWGHLYLYDGKSGELKAQVTQGA